MQTSTLDPAGANDHELVVLDAEHPGFRDPEYRLRRNAIARVALTYRSPQPVPDVTYTDDEHGVWRAIWAELVPLHRRLACADYLAASERLALDRHVVPQLRQVNDVIGPISGFRLLPVAGLLEPAAFLERLGAGEFMATQYIRHHSRPLYTPEPDVVHEVVGHAPTLIDPRLVRINRAFGAAARRGGDVTDLIRTYWYTVEFGVVREGSELKAYGAGLLSSAGELARFATDADLRPFDLDAMAALPFDPTGYQDTLFVAPSMARLEDEISRWLSGRVTADR